MDETKIDDMIELGDSGLQRYSGYIFEEFEKKLQGANKYRVYKEMSENDPTINAIIYAIEYLIRQTEWWVEPFSKSPEDVEKAQFLQSCMDDMEHTWQEMLS